jgi:hypothetical protein
VLFSFFYLRSLKVSFYYIISQSDTHSCQLNGAQLGAKQYESSTDSQTILKYGHYAFRLAETYSQEKFRKIIIAVIYTGEIEKAHDYLDLGSVKIRLEQVFLSKFNGSKIYNYLKTKIEGKEPLSDEDVMKLIILPLTQKNNKQEFIEKTVSLAQEIPDEERQGVRPERMLLKVA